jgi:ribonuclease Z
MKITLLGTGSPEAHARRASSGCLVETAGERTLIDCGGGVFDRLLAAGLRPSDLDRLVFTHLHSDHMMDYARLVHARWDERGADLPVWGPAPIAEITGRFFGPEGAFAFDLAARTGLPQSRAVWVARGGALPRPWPAPAVTEVATGFSRDGLTAFEVPHAQPYLTCLGWRIEAEGRVVVHAGDSGHNDALRAACRGADLLVHWCYRLSHEPLPDPAFAATTPGHLETARMAAEAGVKHLVLTHFRGHHDAPGVLDRARAEAQAVFPGRLTMAEDLTEITL